MKRSLRLRAMDYLARREHSVHELKQKLLQKGFDQDAVNTTLQALVEDGLLSDQRFTEAYVHYRSNLGFGPKHIEQVLCQKGIRASMIQAIFNTIDWKAAISTAFNRKFNEVARFPSEAYIKQSRFLMQRGFSAEAVRQLLQEYSL